MINQRLINKPITKANKGNKGNWIIKAPGELDRIEAFFTVPAYAAHRHDTYAIGLTLTGQQCFNYRGAQRHNEAGFSFILHPDEMHDGQPGSQSGMGYRVVYIEPAKIQQVLGGKPLPFIKDGVSNDPDLHRAIVALLGDMDHALTDLEYQDAIFDLATALDKVSGQHQGGRKSCDYRAAELARQYINAHLDQEITLDTLEQISGRDRWQLSRDFRELFGTSPYRYLIMRRLDLAQAMMLCGKSSVEAALSCYFSDQSHMIRHFKKTFGLTPKQLLNAFKQSL